MMYVFGPLHGVVRLLKTNNSQASEEKKLESFGSIADGAQKIRDECSTHGGLTPATTAGQVFHKTNWNVIVRKDSC